MQADAPASPASTSESVAAAPEQQSSSPAQEPSPAPAASDVSPQTETAQEDYPTSPTPTSQSTAPASPEPIGSPATSALSGTGEHQSNADEPRRGHRIGPADFEPGRASNAGASTQATSQTSTQTGPVQAVSDPASVAEAVDPRPKPRQSTSFILASGLSRDDLTKLTAQGFHVETQTQGRITPQVVRLRIPQGASLTQARQNIRLVDARASADFDHYYYLDEGAGTCTGPECSAIALVNWSMSDASRCGPTPLIGLIDTGINLEHEALKDQAIEVLPPPASHLTPPCRIMAPRLRPSLPDGGGAKRLVSCRTRSSLRWMPSTATAAPLIGRT